MHSRGKLYEKNWKTADGKPATIDDISVFVIPLTPYKEEYLKWKQEYEAIRDIYETSCETSEGFGKLSLKTSPVATEKAVNRVLATENIVNRGSLYNDSGVSSASIVPSHNSDTAVNNDDKICALSSCDESSLSVTEIITSGDNLSSHYNHDVEIRDIPFSSEDSASSRDEKEDCVPVSTVVLFTDPHITSEVDAVSQPKDPSQESNSLTQK
jgi:hypothetical protein